MEIVYFVYGLSFFILGLVVLLLNDTTSKYKLATCFWLLAVFGLLHGASEWLEMFLFHGKSDLSQVTLMWFMYINNALLISSFLFLFAFGIQALIVLKKNVINWLNYLVIIMCLLILFILMIHATLFEHDFAKHAFLNTVVILSRYSLGFFGAVLTGVAFLIWKCQPEIRKLGSKLVNIGFIGTGITFIMYAILAGVIVQKAAFFPASIINHLSFIKLVGVPVQVARTLCAVIVTIFIFGVLKIFSYKEKSDLIDRAEHDALTKSYNRQAFNDLYMQECERSRRYKKHLSVLFADIDDFKEYNDNYGHTAGDMLLKRLANLILNHTRLVDYVFRYGGDEFVILLPETSTQAAMVTAERIRKAFSELILKPKKDSVVHKTMSIGVAAFNKDSRPFIAIDLADKAMYQAKKSGKNRVCMSNE